MNVITINMVLIWYIRVASKNDLSYDLRKVENFSNISKLHGIITSDFPPKMESLPILKKITKN